MGPTGLSCVKDQDTGNLRDTELRLGLPGTGAAAQEKPTAAAAAATRGSKRALPADTDKAPADLRSGQDPPPAKAQVVGWPPVRANRMRNTLPARKEAAEKDEAAGLVMYVKVSMDGAPYLRKIDLKIYRGYRELRDALDGMFSCFSLGGSGSEYAIAYEDKDGDLMMVGDVPWEMFNPSCKRLKIMKATEAKGLQSRQ